MDQTRTEIRISLHQQIFYSEKLNLKKYIYYSFSFDTKWCFGSSKLFKLTWITDSPHLPYLFSENDEKKLIFNTTYLTQHTKQCLDAEQNFPFPWESKKKSLRHYFLDIYSALETNCTSQAKIPLIFPYPISGTSVSKKLGLHFVQECHLNWDPLGED